MAAQQVVKITARPHVARILEEVDLRHREVDEALAERIVREAIWTLAHDLKGRMESNEDLAPRCIQEFADRLSCYVAALAQLDRDEPPLEAVA